MGVQREEGKVVAVDMLQNGVVGTFQTAGHCVLYHYVIVIEDTNPEQMEAPKGPGSSI